MTCTGLLATRVGRIALIFSFIAMHVHAADYGRFANAFDEAVFCAVAVPTVSRTIGKQWSAKELGDRFKHALKAVTDEARKLGLTENQKNLALNDESVRQESAISSGHLKEMINRYRYCDKGRL
jgi:hypothetical protein